MFTPDGTNEWMFMACPEFEDRIIEWQDGLLAPAAAAEVEQHVAACSGCRMFATGLRTLDGTMAEAFRTAHLPADFKQRLLARIDNDAPCVPATRERFEAEFRDWLAGLKSRVWREHFGTVLDGVGIAGLIVLGLAYLQPFLARHAGGYAGANSLSAAAVSWLMWGSVALALLTGLGFAGRRRLLNLFA